MEGRKTNVNPGVWRILVELASLIVDVCLYCFFALRTTIADYSNVVCETHKNRLICNVKIDEPKFQLKHLVKTESKGDSDLLLGTFEVMLDIDEMPRVTTIILKAFGCQIPIAHECSQWEEPSMPMLDLTCETIETSDYIHTSTEPKLFSFSSRKKSAFTLLDCGSALSMKKMASKVTRVTETSFTYVKAKSSSWIGAISDDVKMK
ncbi:hypothetical protein ABG067_004326 [Albugo candida]